MKPEHVRRLRNLDLSALGGHEQVWASLEKWASTVPIQAADDIETAQIWHDVFAETSVLPWSTAMWNGFQESAREFQAGFARALWTWWCRDKNLVQVLSSSLPMTPRVENGLLASLPTTIPFEVAERVRILSAERLWFRLHGAVLMASRDLDIAVATHLKIDQEPTRLVGVQAVLTRANREKVLALALQFRDPRLVQLAGRACATETTLLSEFDPADPTWLNILYQALDCNSEAWRALLRPRALVETLVQRAIAGEPVPRELWVLLSTTALGDLSDNPRRRELWPHIPAGIRLLVLARTAQGWLDRFEQNPDFETDVEQELELLLIEQGRRTQFLTRMTQNNIAAGARLFRKLSRLTERHFVDWLDQIIFQTPTDGLSASDATALGQAVSVRSWSTAAGRIARQANTRQDFRPAFAACIDALSWLDKAALFLRRPSNGSPRADELWQQFEDIAADLYPTGPEEEEIWSRAGGAIGRLSQSGTGRARWHNILRAMRRGGDQISPSRLVSEMLRDFPTNERLLELSAHSPFNTNT